ncbi:hypothetical protein N7494_008827 [Penicillium frequentans]|uniref:NB-ARC domain-containing protein n=1 Tax=Penicillium frequentans TaxID=3151616 RepID=A0AAD6CP93_9EURO|nr:hypothetical protein N7494_008827 [Penicillium glabrum]
MPLRLNRDAYRVGWICPMEVEHTAAVEMLDEQHDRLPVPRGDAHVYNLGSIHGHNVVIIGLAGVGNNYAADAVAQMKITFPSLRYALVVGIGGGVPGKKGHEIIRLGHVVVGQPIDVHTGAVQYDHGRWSPGQFERKGFLSPPPTALLSAAQELARQRKTRNHDPVWANLKKIPTDRPAFRRYKFPGVANDHLYQPDHVHRVKGLSCEKSGCDPQKRIKRILGKEEESFVVVHRGTIATGGLVMKDAIKRDELAGTYNALCFETEAAGALTDFPCLVIRGISDYCDTHKNDVWHGYAAAVAAAYARELFYHMPVEEPETDRKSPSYIVPRLSNRHFTGRTQTLEELQQRLFIQADTSMLALFGLGGIGKTQVALQLADWVIKNRPEFSVFWVPALSLQTFEQACSRIAKKVGIQHPSDDECESAMDLVYDYLSSSAAGKWLFIVDNADDHDLLFNKLGQYFPVSENNGVTLFTTRSREVAVTFASSDIVELGKMTLAEGEAFLTKIMGKDLLCSPQLTTQLLEELHFLPLAIVQAAFYMSKLGVNISKYLEIMHNTEKDRADLASRDFHDRTRYASLPNAVMATWTISFEQIRKTAPNAAELLEFLSYIEPKEIPRSMLPTPKSKENTEYAIGVLCSYAFLTKEDDGNAYDMHGLVQLATKRWVEEDGHARQVIQKVIQRMDECFPSYENYNLENCRAYLPHALKIIRRAESQGISERYSLLIKVGDFAYLEGREKEALSFFEDASTWHKSQNDEENRQFSEHALANAYRSSKQTKRAVQILARVVEARRKTAAKDDRSLLAYQYALAMAYKSDHQIKRAVNLLKEVVAIQKSTLSKEDRDLLSSQHALANAYRSDRQIKLAVQTLEGVVTIQKNTFSKQDRDLLSSQQALAKAYRSDGQIERAVQTLEDVVKIQKDALDEKDPSLLSSQQALAKAYKSDGNIKLAVKTLEHVVNVRKNTLDPKDRYLLRSQRVLAKAYRSDGQIESAVQILEHVVNIQEDVPAEDHDRLLSQHALAILYRFNGQSQRAVPVLEHVVAVQEKLLGKSHPHLLSSQHALGKAYYLDRQIDKAVSVLELVVEVRKDTLDKEDLDLLASEKSLAKAKKAAEAEEKAEEKTKPKANKKAKAKKKKLNRMEITCNESGSQ